MLEQITALLRSWRQSPPQVPIQEQSRGKLSKIIECLNQSDGATIDDLMTLTGWQRHTVHGALSHLRWRGLLIKHLNSPEFARHPAVPVFAVVQS